MARRIRKILRYIFNTFSILIVAAAVVLMVSVIFTEQGSIPNVMGYSMLRVMTGSMEPEIPTNSLIIVKHQKAEELQPGDVISYYSADPSLDGMVNTHRVTRIETDGSSYTIYTKGDANELEDEYPTDADHLVGKVVWDNHQLGVIVRLISNPLIFIPIIIAPLLIILFHHVRQVVHTTKEISKEQDEAYKEALTNIYQKKKQRQKEKETTEPPVRDEKGETEENEEK